MTPRVKALINGDARDSLSIQDRGFQYGDGVFETIAVYRGRPLLWDKHLRRLHKGCARLGIEHPPDEHQLRQEAERLCDGVNRAVLKIVVTRGEAGRGYVAPADAIPTRIVSLAAWPDYPGTNAIDGVNVRICRTPVSQNPRLAGIKHLNRLEQVLARSEWRSEFDEGLMLDIDDHVVEGTMSNIFLISQGTLLTPALSQSGVEGVMRETVLNRAEALSLPYRIVSVSHEMLDSADAIFLTNSVIGIWPVKRVESRSYGIDAMTRRLQEAIKEFHCFGQVD